MAKEVPVETLAVGARFALVSETSGRVLYGTLIEVSSGSALVEWDSSPRTVDLRDANGKRRVFQASVKKREHICLKTPVIPV